MQKISKQRWAETSALPAKSGVAIHGVNTEFKRQPARMRLANRCALPTLRVQTAASPCMSVLGAFGE
jgi:hypothetical protein